jgi:hypothetical protein
MSVYVLLVIATFAGVGVVAALLIAEAVNIRATKRLEAEYRRYNRAMQDCINALYSIILGKKEVRHGEKKVRL